MQSRLRGETIIGRLTKLRIPGIALFAVFNVAGVHAASLSSRYIRTTYGPEVGISQTVVNSITQSRQGFLWMAGRHGRLIRFDGQSFYEVPAPLADTVALAPNGDLWITRTSPAILMRIAAKELDQFGELPATSYPFNVGAPVTLNYLQFGRGGTLWLATNRGLYRFDHGKFVAVIPGPDISRLEETLTGHLLMATTEGYLEWDGAKLVSHPEIAKELGLQPRQIFHVYEDRRGAMWYCTASGIARRIGSAIVKLEPWGAGHGTYRVYEDPSGALWFIRADGIYRAIDNGLELFDKETSARWLFTDREGQLWIATNGSGIIRLHEAHARTFTTADGLPSNVIMTTIVRADGTIWAGANCGGLSRFDGEHFHTYSEKDGLLNACVFALAEDAAHDLWVGTYGAGAFRFHDGVFTQFSTQQGLASGVVTGILVSRDGAVWLATPAGATRMSNGEVQNYLIAGAAVRVFNFYQDRSGVIWAGTSAGLARLDRDRFVIAVAASPGAIQPVGEDEAGRIYLTQATVAGLFRLENGKIVSVESQLAAVNSVLKDHDGMQWFIGEHLIGVAPGELSKPRASDEPLDFRMIERDDGLTRDDCSVSFPCAAIDREGRLWVATLSGLALIDIPRLPKSDRTVPLYMKAVTYGRTRQAPDRELVLPPGTTHIDLQFEAIELVAPEKIRLQYRMDGIDKEWLDADTTGIATYSKIPPATHEFHMRACNRDGFWDRVGVVYRVTQQPYFYETNVFQVSVVLVIGLMLFAGYRFRIRQVAAEMNVRFEERLNERTRIAREVHDTLLQIIQGSKLVADEALDENADLPHVRRALVRLSGWLSQAIQEGRAVLSALRASTLEGNNLAEALQRAIVECQLQYPIECDLTVEGSSREMHPIVRDEVYRIAYEAIRNACMHSGGKHVNVELGYGRDLTVRVRDDGHGMDSDTRTKGKESHYGIVGMYERATGIGAKLMLTSSPISGTEVELMVPGHIIFEHAKFSMRAWIARIRGL